MKRLTLPLLLALSSMLLTSCGAMRHAWGEAYRHQGGYYDSQAQGQQPQK